MASPEEPDAVGAEPPPVVEEPAAAADAPVEADANATAPPAKRRRKVKPKDDAGPQKANSLHLSDGAVDGQAGAQEVLPNVPLWRLQRKDVNSRKWTRKWWAGRSALCFLFPPSSQL